MDEKKKRGSNYTPSEKDMLLELIKKYQTIIENKETNAHNILKKREAWNAVCQQYNAVAVSGIRTWQQLRHLYENIKQNSKKNIAKANRLQYYEITKDAQKKASLDKKEINRTGGGAYKSVLTEQDAQILAMVAPQIRPLPNCYDDAAIYFGDTEATGSNAKIVESENLPLPEIEIIPDSYNIENQDMTTDNVKDNHTITSINIPEDQEITIYNVKDNYTKPCTITSINIPDNQRAVTVMKPPRNTKTTPHAAGQINRKNITIKQQYFRTKLRNAKLETKYLINKNKMEINRNKMEINKYKLEMQILNLKLQKLK